ncbi:MULTISPECIES: hypothetical protein [unclassified Mesorhizobium]|uniref:hypothetical protein n=1 Tax=unclassified Mesorhizobium TaxID=325217 RepID=UPI0010928E29|nr:MULTISPECIES: hypothetical protein [unclassified Mesorhizobium]TGP93824.1 hypothetical protein EN861_17190 [Mesorhizobium sp. M8A.F.Ca.ET.218.01.1.1]TGT18121.1 hypothetical protein EN856_16720 [Mesorhizobium sp. M8A.F.Ca.ET.213.01.1.1]
MGAAETSATFGIVFDALAVLFSGGHCPKPGCIGEVAAGDYVLSHDDGTSLYSIAAYVWHDDFDDVGLVADTARVAGACDVVISHILHDTLNDETGGRTIDNTRAWNIDVWIAPAEGRKPDRASAGQAAQPEGQPPAGGDAAREASQ